MISKLRASPLTSSVIDARPAAVVVVVLGAEAGEENVLGAVVRRSSQGVASGAAEHSESARFKFESSQNSRSK